MQSPSTKFVSILSTGPRSDRESQSVRPKIRSPGYMVGEDDPSPSVKSRVKEWEVRHFTVLYIKSWKSVTGEVSV